MAAANTDLLKKLSKRWVGQIGAAGVADATVTTVPLSSTTNLATDTAVIATIDRVDANGVATAALEEGVIGVVSGSNLINCVRATEGTAQAHNAGAVVEILVTAKGYNDIIDGFLVGHTQLGAHKASLALTTPTLTSPVINTGVSGTAIDTDGTLAANSDIILATQKAIRTYVAANAGTTDGWTPSSDTWVYASASTFTIAGVDRTAIYTKGTRLKFTQTTAKYAVVLSSSFSTNTTVTIAVNTDYTIANAAITLPYYSYQVNPQGYPGWFAYTPIWTGFSVNPTGTFIFNVIGSMCTVVIKGDSNGTSNGTGLTVTVPAIALSNNNHNTVVALDNSVQLTTVSRVDLPAASNTITAYKDLNGAAWTNSSGKSIWINLSYQI